MGRYGLAPRISKDINHTNALGDREKATTKLQAELKRHAVVEEKRAAKRRREDEESALVLADLQTRLEASEERADEAEAKAEALKTKARMHSNRLFQSLARAQKRLDEIETSKTSVASSSTATPKQINTIISEFFFS